MTYLLEAVNEFLEKDGNGEIGTIPENGIIDLAFTTCEDTGDGEIHLLQVSFDTKALKYLHYVDDELVLEHQLSCIEDFITDMQYCDFDDILHDCVVKCFDLYGKEDK